MKLELKHLAPYLPYKLKLIPDCGNDGKLTSLDAEIGYVNFGWGDAFKIEDVKPVLRPLSDLLKYVWQEGEQFKVFKTFGLIDELEDQMEWIGEGRFFTQEIPYEIMEVLFEGHFDVFDLLGEGLATDINTLNK